MKIEKKETNTENYTYQSGLICDSAQAGLLAVMPDGTLRAENPAAFGGIESWKNVAAVSGEDGTPRFCEGTVRRLQPEKTAPASAGWSSGQSLRG